MVNKKLLSSILSLPKHLKLTTIHRLFQRSISFRSCLPFAARTARDPRLGLVLLAPAWARYGDVHLRADLRHVLRDGIRQQRVLQPHKAEGEGDMRPPHGLHLEAFENG